MNQEKPDMRWLVKNRSALQKTALDLYLLIEKAKGFEDMQSSLTKQDLVGVLFCLWRGVFLAHGKDSKPGKSPKAAKDFLQKIIEDNSIVFSDEKTWREWTANFYIDSAGHLLAGFTSTHRSDATPRLDDLKPRWELHEYPARIKKRWKYNHDNLRAKLRSFAKKVNGSNNHRTRK